MKKNNLDIYMLVAKNIRENRNRQGLTIEELAEKSNISVSFLSYIETGKKKPSLSTLFNIAKGLKIDISNLFITSKKVKYESQDDLNQYLKETPSKYRKNFIEIIKNIHKNFPKK